jgi:hypothetical protein
MPLVIFGRAAVGNDISFRLSLNFAWYVAMISSKSCDLCNSQSSFWPIQADEEPGQYPRAWRAGAGAKNHGTHKWGLILELLGENTRPGCPMTRLALTETVITFYRHSSANLLVDRLLLN